MREPAVLVLDAHRDSLFLSAGQLEYLERSPLAAGDAVVVCADCRTIYREENWRLLQGTCALCGGRSTVAFREGANALLRQLAIPVDRPRPPPPPPPGPGPDERRRPAARPLPARRTVFLAAPRHLLAGVAWTGAVAAAIVFFAALGEAHRTVSTQPMGRDRAREFLQVTVRQLIRGDSLSDPYEHWNGGMPNDREPDHNHQVEDQ